MGKEIEVKVLNIDIDEVKNRLINIGAVLIKHELQTNKLFDVEDKLAILGANSYLRLRKIEDKLNSVESYELTLKENIPNQKARENIETNVIIDNEENLLKILSVLGVSVEQIGYKERVSYKINNVLVEIDIWDKETYPNPYLEIEGEDIDSIYKTLDLLGLSRENVTTKSILELRQDVGLA